MGGWGSGGVVGPQGWRGVRSTHIQTVPGSAFNNILSNLGYVLLGLLFLLIILQREINYNRALMRNDTHALVRGGWHARGVSAAQDPPASPPSLSTLQECGIPKHFGLFYAMGTALMMEGLLSACYHVCPNYTNFQFGECPHLAPRHCLRRGHPAHRCPSSPADTSFMYMIAGLCMLKLYQKRHPDINASAYSAYACLALVIFFSVVGVVSTGGAGGGGKSVGRSPHPLPTAPARPAGLWQGEHGLLDCLLRHPHRGHPAAEHPALLHGALEAG